MKTHVLKGSKQEIAENLVRMAGDIREVIVFEGEPAPSAEAGVPGDLFAEMGPFMVDVRNVDDAREAIYTRTNDE